MSVFLIAEVGINHNGDISIAKKLIDGAASAGFDAVKFQKRTIDKVYSKEYLDSQEKVLGEPLKDNRKKGWSLEIKNLRLSMFTVKEKYTLVSFSMGCRLAKIFT